MDGRNKGIEGIEERGGKADDPFEDFEPFDGVLAGCAEGDADCLALARAMVSYAERRRGEDCLSKAAEMGSEDARRLLAAVGRV